MPIFPLSVNSKKESECFRECGGRGICYLLCLHQRWHGKAFLRLVIEKADLEVIAEAILKSRLACQVLVIGEGIIVEVPSGDGRYMLIEDIES